MGNVIRVSLPTYDALTDTNPDHFALYSDEDWVLIKEYTRGSVSANSGGQTVNFDLDYIPTILVYFNDNGIWKELTGRYYDFNTNLSTPHVIIVPGIISFYGNSIISTNFKYFICYDQQV